MDYRRLKLRMPKGPFDIGRLEFQKMHLGYDRDGSSRILFLAPVIGLVLLRISEVGRETKKDLKVVTTTRRERQTLVIRRWQTVQAGLSFARSILETGDPLRPVPSKENYLDQ